MTIDEKKLTFNKMRNIRFNSLSPLLKEALYGKSMELIKTNDPSLIGQ
jgi:hypothetical protein